MESLDQQVLADLFDLKYIAVRVPGFYDPMYSKSLSGLLYQEIDDSASGGIYESNIDSFWNVMKDKERRERYFNVALPLQQRLRRLSAPYPSPVDLLRLALDEAWPGGAGLMKMSGRKMPFGITRLWRTGSEALPHQDVLHREIGEEDDTVRLVSQLGVNIYLDTADEGGELETWDHVITDEAYEDLRDEYEGSYGYPRSMLPEESLLISPEVGDLVMVNTTCAHAVRKITRGRRMTVSGFVGNSGTDQPLRCWS
ncbi:2OG-Fe(II) oxygenase [Streptomyces sp. 7N604]|uniref:2OG-Fe(II) oxygenase n=1 Tax=Streptomyces sp. 7N604 TaxID=3457415 RepID=UPI003FD537BE